MTRIMNVKPKITLYAWLRTASLSEGLHLEDAGWEDSFRLGEALIFLCICTKKPSWRNLWCGTYHRIARVRQTLPDLVVLDKCYLSMISRLADLYTEHTQGEARVVLVNLDPLHQLNKDGEIKRRSNEG